MGHLGQMPPPPTPYTFSQSPFITVEQGTVATELGEIKLYITQQVVR